MVTTVREAIPDQVVLLNVSWGAYQALSTALGDSRAVRLSYYEETLQILSPGPLHESISKRISDLLTIIVAEWDMNIVGTQSTTFQNADSVNGFEADQSYYIASVENVRDITTVDIMVDPPPDLVIEIDITTPEVEKIDKHAMYERVHVPEFWRYSQENGLEAFALRDTVYQPITISEVIAGLPIGEIAKRLRTTPKNLRAVIREWQDWLRTHRPQSL